MIPQLTWSHVKISMFQAVHSSHRVILVFQGTRKDPAEVL